MVQGIGFRVLGVLTGFVHGSYTGSVGVYGVCIYMF